MVFLPSGSVADTGKDPRQQEQATDTRPADEYRKLNVTVNGFAIVADIASTGDQRSKGLAVKDHLQEHEGMLFVFSKPNEYQFWMYNMKFPIDIMWLDSDRKVVHIEHNLEPCGPESCPTYKPDENALYVLETVAGFAEKHRVTEGTAIEFNPEDL